MAVCKQVTTLDVILDNNLPLNITNTCVTVVCVLSSKHETTKILQYTNSVVCSGHALGCVVIDSGWFDACD